MYSDNYYDNYNHHLTKEELSELEQPASVEQLHIGQIVYLDAGSSTGFFEVTEFYYEPRKTDKRYFTVKGLGRRKGDDGGVKLDQIYLLEKRIICHV